jgi:hypothetical protein
MATMFKRTQVKATPVRDFKPELPSFVSDVIHRCLEIQVHRRYQSAREILQDLGAWRGGSSPTLGPTMRALRPTTTAGSRRLRRGVVAGAVAGVLVLVAAALRCGRAAGPRPMARRAPGCPRRQPTRCRRHSALP